MKATTPEKSGLLIVDVQVDFCPGGSLPVAEGDGVIQTLNHYSELFYRKGLQIFASRDWHPPQTSHFKDFGGTWPIHCVMGTRGAAFHANLRLPPSAVIISKGMDPSRDDYSALDGVDDNGTPFANLLRSLDIDRLYIGGLATDYCVKESSLEAIRQGLSVTLLEDAIRGVDLHPGDSQRAMEEMKAAGVEIITFDKMHLA